MTVALEKDATVQEATGLDNISSINHLFRWGGRVVKVRVPVSGWRKAAKALGSFFDGTPKKVLL